MIGVSTHRFAIFTSRLFRLYIPSEIFSIMPKYFLAVECDSGLNIFLNLEVIAMKNLIDWTASLSVGIDSIDNQHKKLVDLLNKLYAAMTEGKGSEILGNIFGDLVNYTKTHFATEEQYFAKYKYPDSAKHISEHKILTDKAKALQADFKSGKVAMSREVMQFLKDWLNNHIAFEDKKYGPFLRENGVK